MEAHYHLSQYWDSRYSFDKDPFEWFQKYGEIRGIISSYVTDKSNVLVVGCGSSELSSELYADGVKFITNLDFSSKIIDHLKATISDAPEMKFECMDACSMKYDGQFDVVIDKATFDCVLCGEGCRDRAARYLSNIARALTPDGVYICISHAEPAMRDSYLKGPQLPWEVETKEIPKPTLVSAEISSATAGVHYVYICKKTGDF
ncbi:Endothelin-converting enzyme 2 [Aduncisulcus paluster]|uniref:Endothelin-converting enzyme 2 n=1 Tax=Aduncisulcus paluster TaxID=2918883 RepID=A0ABQ5KK58_9EUKA|nr:Endothelin-converting enzyme 2 [Aduncisulcus paluster]